MQAYRRNLWNGEFASRLDLGPNWQHCIRLLAVTSKVFVKDERGAGPRVDVCPIRTTLSILARPAKDAAAGSWARDLHTILANTIHPQHYPGTCRVGGRMCVLFFSGGGGVYIRARC